jgi:hypothetical protein
MFLPRNVPVVGPVWMPRLRRLGVSAYLEIFICYWLFKAQALLMIKWPPLCSVVDPSDHCPFPNQVLGFFNRASKLSSYIQGYNTRQWRYCCESTCRRAINLSPWTTRPSCWGLNSWSSSGGINEQIMKSFISDWSIFKDFANLFVVSNREAKYWSPMAQCSERKRRTCWHVMPELFSLCDTYHASDMDNHYKGQIFKWSSFFRLVFRNAKSFNRNAKIILPQF